jgi:hypothetical protein
MAGLFIELYLDEDVSVLVAELLRGRGFAALTTRDAGRLGSNDAAQLNFAAVEGLTLLSHNRADFEALASAYTQSQKTHSGIILARRHPTHELVRRLLLILNHVTADEIKDQVRYI